MNDPLSPETFQHKMTEQYNKMDDNTAGQSGGLRFAKLHISAQLIDEVSDHYGFFDLVESNTMAFQILHILAQIEKDGFELCIFKSKTDESGVKKIEESYVFDIHKLIHDIRLKSTAKISK